MDNIKISKKISYWLRHNPDDANLSLDENGWCKIDDILNALKNILSINDLIEINEKSSKKRWEFDLNNNKIRATHGHSVEIELPNKTETPPKILFHGTSIKYLENIILNGLISKSRKYVHLTDDLKMAIETGQRHGKLIIIEIDSHLLKNQEFYNTSKNVWLTTNVNPGYLNFFPWIFTDQIAKDFLKKELLKELSKTKKEDLDVKNITAMMRRADNDDVLYYSKNKKKYYQIHLTYTTINSEGFPSIKEFDSFSEWLKNELIPDNRNYYNL